ncbi:MAG: hypothetical protein WAZ12_04910 [Candidatus Absconditicoccaceae bacterium]
MEVRKINKEATIQNIIEWANKSVGNTINAKFYQEMEQDNWEATLKDVTKFCKVEIVYEI